MADARQEKLLVETMKSLLDQDELGLVTSDYEEKTHHVQYQWEDILSDFAVAIKDSDFFDALNAAFYKVHVYKWIEDSTFEEALVSELESMGIPHEEITKALDGLEKVRKDYIGGDKNNENSVAWDNIEDLTQVTQDPKNPPITPIGKENMNGDKEPYNGVEPDSTRPNYSEA